MTGMLERCYCHRLLPPKALACQIGFRSGTCQGKLFTFISWRRDGINLCFSAFVFVVVVRRHAYLRECFFSLIVSTSLKNSQRDCFFWAKVCRNAPKGLFPKRLNNHLTYTEIFSSQDKAHPMTCAIYDIREGGEPTSVAESLGPFILILEGACVALFYKPRMV